MDQYEHSTSLDQMGLDESTVMAFQLDPDCMFNLLAIVNIIHTVSPKVWRHAITAHVSKVCFIARLVESIAHTLSLSILLIVTSCLQIMELST